jgi:hypothetical protein
MQKSRLVIGLVLEHECLGGLLASGGGVSSSIVTTFYARYV